MATNDLIGQPLGWSATECGPDVDVHIATARKVAGTLMAIDGQRQLDSLPTGAVCTLMIMLDRELQAATDILEKGDES